MWWSSAAGGNGLASDTSGGERLHVRIAHSGLCSRRTAEQLILEGRVTVNNEPVVVLGTKVTEDDVVAVDGEVLGVARLHTVVLNKPVGIVTTMSDPQGRPTVKRLLPDLGVPLKPVGRLDMDTSGLLLCTNDGELANRLMHPKYGVDKEYEVTVVGVPDEKALGRLAKGVFIEGRKTAPARVELLHRDPKGATSRLRITVHEGRKRQIRLMCQSVGHPVQKLERTRYAFLRLKGMRPGECRRLGQKEVDQLRKMVGLA